MPHKLYVFVCIINEILEYIMSFKISFQGMPHSIALENYAREKMAKIAKLLGENISPLLFDFHLKSHTERAHQEALLNLQVKQIHLSVTSEDKDMYLAIDETVSKIINLLKKEKAKISSKKRNLDHNSLTNNDNLEEDLDDDFDFEENE